MQWGNVCSCMSSHTISLAHMVWKEWCWHQEIRWWEQAFSDHSRWHSSSQKKRWAQTPFPWNNGWVGNNELQPPNVTLPHLHELFSCTWQNPICYQWRCFPAIHGESLLPVPGRYVLGPCGFTSIFCLSWHIMPSVKYCGKWLCMNGLVFYCVFVCVLNSGRWKKNEIMPFFFFPGK